MRLPLRDNQRATLFNVYVPTLLTDPADDERFYPDFQPLTERPSK